MCKIIIYSSALLLIPLIKSTLLGLNIEKGCCPLIRPAPNLNPLALEGVWTVSQRSTNLIAGHIDCQNFVFLRNNFNNFQVFTILSNAKTEVAKAFQAHSISTVPGILALSQNYLKTNIILKGVLTVVATDNASFAVVVQCEEKLGFRAMIVYVLIKGVVAPPNLDACVAQALLYNNLTLIPSLKFKNLERKCQISYKI